MVGKELFTPGRFFIKDAKTGEIIKYFNTYSDAMDGYTKGVEMTDKEQIIIDGVNVSGCYLKNEDGDCALSYADLYSDSKELQYGLYCGDNPNCYFKQLARKTQECEELKEKLKFKDYENSNLNKKYRQEQEGRRNYRKAIEEIENFMNYEFSGQNEWVKIRILDIIGKAKEEE